MRLFYCFLFFICLPKCQNYQLTCFGFHTTDIKQKIYHSKRIDFEIQNRGLMDIIWPAHNKYITYFDSSTFFLKSWEKNINQGTYKNSLNAKIDSSQYMLYNNNQIFKINNPLHTIFTLLAMVQSLSSKSIDTKWFNYEHQGRIGKARFLWADSTMVWNGKDSILCDHYRMDINIKDSTHTIKTTKDYFMDNIYHSIYVKELWVMRNKKRLIVKASAKSPWVTFIARLND